MTNWQAIFLGLIQGFTEFFPISSSTHLSLAEKTLGLEEPLVIFDLFTHFGTLAVLVIFLKKDILEILRSPQKRLQVLVALIPLVPAYFLLKPLRVIAGKDAFLGMWLLATATLLFLSQKTYAKRISPKKGALVIGSLQAMALIPGISRSASTICGGKLAGLSPQEAVRFSFLLSIPTILGGMTLEGGKAALNTSMNGSWTPCILGALAAFIGGAVIVRVAFKILEKGYFKPFAWYCLILGIGLCISQIF